MVALVQVFGQIEICKKTTRAEFAFLKGARSFSNFRFSAKSAVKHLLASDRNFGIFSNEIWLFSFLAEYFGRVAAG